MSTYPKLHRNALFFSSTVITARSATLAFQNLSTYICANQLKQNVAIHRRLFLCRLLVIPTLMCLPFSTIFEKKDFSISGFHKIWKNFEWISIAKKITNKFSLDAFNFFQLFPLKYVAGL